MNGLLLAVALLGALPEPTSTARVYEVDQIVELQIVGLTPFGPNLTANVITVIDEGEQVFQIPQARGTNVIQVGPEFLLLVGDKDGPIIFVARDYTLTVHKDFTPPEPRPEPANDA